MTFKPPEVVDPDIDDYISVKVDNWHSWYCGCKSRITKAAFEIIPCKEDCQLYLAVLEEGKILFAATYDELLALYKEAEQKGMLPNGVICRSVEEAEALAAWCEENGFGTPKTEVL